MSSATSRSSSTTSTRPRVRAAGAVFTPRSVEGRGYRTMTPELTLLLPLGRTLAARPLVTLQEIVQPGAGAGERPVRRRDERAQVVDAARPRGPLVDAVPDARLVHDLASPHVGAAARAVAQLLGARLRTHVFEMPEHTVAARLA